MDNRKYRCLAIDAQYFLMKHFSAYKSRSETEMNMVINYPESVEGSYKVPGYTFDHKDIVQSLVWSFAKIAREHVDCDRCILLWDSSPYFKEKILPDFKGHRLRVTQEDLELFDVESDPVGYLKLREQLRVEGVKSEAKYWAVSNLYKIGFPSIIQKGYEADDLAYLFSEEVKNDDRKYIICSVDSDWKFWINENVDLYNPVKKKLITYEDVWNELGDRVRDLGLSLFEAKCYLDSLYNSHNNLKSTTKCRWKDFDKVVSKILEGDYSLVDDVDTFRKNMESFDIISYPGADDMKRLIRTTVDRPPLDNETLLSNFNSLRKGGLKITQRYYKENTLNYINR